MSAWVNLLSDLRERHILKIWAHLSGSWQSVLVLMRSLQPVQQTRSLKQPSAPEASELPGLQRCSRTLLKFPHPTAQMQLFLRSARRTTDICTQELAAEASSSREQKTLSPTFTTVTSQTNVIPITIKQSPNELALDQEGRRGGAWVPEGLSAARLAAWISAPQPCRHLIFQ